MAKKEIIRGKFEDFEIVEEGKKIGEIRVKPSGILWKAKGKHDWMGVTIEQFSEFAEENGKSQKK